jgi:glyoxylase-like metal-dependent hydrolase (beta-lactamase superfamily II)
MGIITECFGLGPLHENTYLITDEATGVKAVVDPGYYGPEITDKIKNVTDLRFILLTHGHYDHFASVSLYKEKYPDAVFVAPAGETHLMYESIDNKWMAISDGSSAGVCPQADRFVKEGDTVSLGETLLRVIETPGHTEGGICFATDSEVFSGDTLFRLSVGNTSFETGNWDMMLESIQNKLYTLDDGIIVYPGHGAATTIGYEKKANPFV